MLLLQELVEGREEEGRCKGGREGEGRRGTESVELGNGGVGGGGGRNRGKACIIDE